MIPKYFNLDDPIAEALEHSAKITKQTQVVIATRAIYRELKKEAETSQDVKLKSLINEFEKRQLK